MTELTAKTETAVARLQELAAVGSDWVYSANPLFEGQLRMTISLPNGYTVSVFTGMGACAGDGTFEVAVLNTLGELTAEAFENAYNDIDTIRGWQTPDEVFAIAQRAAAL